MFADQRRLSVVASSLQGDSYSSSSLNTSHSYDFIQAGLEEEIVFFILQMVYPRHETRSAFTSGSARGWVYLEATMNDHLQRLLRLTPGILCNRCGICFQHIPVNEGLELLKMLGDPPELGKWVQVKRGTYKGDLGYVLSIAASEVRLLLIPRLAPNASHSKRKHSQPCNPLKLFNHKIDNAIDSNSEPHENICSVGNDRFEHGLIVRLYSFDSVSTGVSSIPLEAFSLFRLSGHPELISSKSSFPKPSEWYFCEGEEACMIDHSISSWPPSYKSGIISTLRDDAVELDTEEGIVVVSWTAIYKVMRIGDFVKVTGGLHKDQKGWVDEVNLGTAVANIIRMVDEGTPVFGHVEVGPILNEWPPHAQIPVRPSKYQSIC